jgi:hypothetical protein
MDEARAVIDRLERIEKLERHRVPPAVVLEELRGLVRDAETWARVEGDARARVAVARCDEAVNYLAARESQHATPSQRRGSGGDQPDCAGREPRRDADLGEPAVFGDPEVGDRVATVREVVQESAVGAH